MELKVKGKEEKRVFFVNPWLCVLEAYSVRPKPKCKATVMKWLFRPKGTQPIKLLPETKLNKMD